MQITDLPKLFCGIAEGSKDPSTTRQVKEPSSESAVSSWRVNLMVGVCFGCVILFPLVLFYFSYYRRGGLIARKAQELNLVLQTP